MKVNFVDIRGEGRCYSMTHFLTWIEFVRLAYPERRENIEVLFYLLGKGFTVKDAMNIDYGSPEYKIAFDGMKYERLAC